jgi:hypothetical protein
MVFFKRFAIMNAKYCDLSEYVTEETDLCEFYTEALVG